jgi:nucleoside-diphosphate-sugar epimerase
MPMRVLVTGATGFVGGHVVDACLKRGWSVVAFARPTSNVSDLKKLGVAVVQGEMSDPAACRQATNDVDVVIHCAAKVGDWGPHEDYIQANVDSLRVLLDACKGLALTRFIHLSSLGVYPAKHHYGSDEEMPIHDTHRDGYSRSKVLAEKLALRYHAEFGVPVVVLRPGFVYGPRDRTVLPRIVDNLRQGLVRYPGGGEAALNTIFVRNLVDAIFLAIDHDQAVGQVYNLTDGEHVSKRRFIEKICAATDLPHPRRRPPLWFAKAATWISEAIAKSKGAKEAPAFNFPRLKFMGLNLDFSIEKAKAHLGYRPRVDFDEGMSETLAWYKANVEAGKAEG